MADSHVDENALYNYVQELLRKNIIGAVTVAMCNCVNVWEV